MAVIQLPDEQVVALTAKAEAAGMSLEDWLGALSLAEAPDAETGGRRRGRYKLEDLIAQCDLNALATEEDRVWLEGPPVGREAL